VEADRPAMATRGREGGQEHGPIVLFDGVCGLCTASVRFLIRHDHRAVLRFAAFQSAAGQSLCRSHGIPPERLATLILIRGSEAYQRSDALIATARALGGWWRVLIALRIVPRALRDWGYTLVAKHRYQWFGRRDVCVMPTDDLRARFLP
jgi:predicted DCC family thiol-disulfide oxidoreductase YuxK